MNEFLLDFSISLRGQINNPPALSSGSLAFALPLIT